MASGDERTRVEGVFARLKADILSGDLPPGSKLAFASLSQRYSASVGVTREALSRLTELGLVVAEPQVGFRVPTVTAADLSDLTLARCEIEGSALVQSVEHGDLAWETRVVASHYALERTPVWQGATGDAVSPAWEALHTDFHVALISACPSVRLIDIAASLRDAGQIYRSWSHGVTLNTSHRDFAAEHRAIKDAALARNGAEASELLKSHLTQTADLLLEYLAAQAASSVA
ncbi:GntR family transcriptional regulator [Amycolatopsis pithecellobii]|uniref:FCD domain-containing protein n=1 Tax=Amycolatopsis pithecellobii TaxID=664692 RepID=A0A6N7YXJ0_9PSEU|nr:GntR family transcriptional regulator [Amycolatopsis pithecellobii]MTD53049.1 FCD domain-containing protein [Amycolatopsis pithecellobii]